VTLLSAWFPHLSSLCISLIFLHLSLWSFNWKPANFTISHHSASRPCGYLLYGCRVLMDSLMMSLTLNSSTCILASNDINNDNLLVEEKGSEEKRSHTYIHKDRQGGEQIPQEKSERWEKGKRIKTFLISPCLLSLSLSLLTLLTHSVSFTLALSFLLSLTLLHSFFIISFRIPHFFSYSRSHSFPHPNHREKKNFAPI
jgi:hypothetical protein